MSSHLPRSLRVALLLLVATLLAGIGLAAPEPKPEVRFLGVINIDPPHVSTDKSVGYDFDIVYVRAAERRWPCPLGRSR